MMRHIVSRMHPEWQNQPVSNDEKVWAVVVLAVVIFGILSVVAWWATRKPKS